MSTNGSKTRRDPIGGRRRLPRARADAGVLRERRFRYLRRQSDGGRGQVRGTAEGDRPPARAMAILRHSKIALTMDIYSQVSSTSTREALKRLGEAFG